MTNHPAGLAAIFLSYGLSLVAGGQTCSDCDRNGVIDSVEQAAVEGLVGQYFRSQGSGNFTERLLARIDPNVAFQWNGESPDPAVPPNDFAVRWTGTLLPTVTGTYTFWTTTDDGVRLWVAGQLIINKWQPQSPTTWSATIDLVAGQRYDFRMDYYEGGGGAEAKLEWRVPGGERTVVPPSAFRPLADVDGDGWPDACGDCDGNGVVDAAEIAAGTATDCDGDCLTDACVIGQAATRAYWRFENEGKLVEDASASGLDGVPADLTYADGTLRAVVPANGFTNERSAALGPAGRFAVADPAGVLASGGEGFTVEAWVRLVDPADSPTAEARRVLVQRKPLAAGDASSDFIVFAQAGNVSSAGVANYGRQGNFTGREIAVLFGNGGTTNPGFWTVTSNLRIDDEAWHFVAVAVDAVAGEVRFTVDGTTERHAFVDRGRVIVAAPVLVGAHTNASGSINQFLRGRLDEVRISAGAVPENLLLARAGGSDCNANGIPDSCDLYTGVLTDCSGDGVPDACEPDCNGNGVPDPCDLGDGFSTDCNEDGIPDDCQLEGNDCDADAVPDDCQLEGNDCNANGTLDRCDLASGASGDCDANQLPDECQLGLPFIYRLDDGGPEFGIRADGTQMAWLTNYRVTDGARMVHGIDIMFVFAPTTQDAKLYVWSDPNGDGDPTDAQVLATRTVPIATLGVLQSIDLPAVDVGPNGTSFFVGAITSVTSGDFPGPLDTSGGAVLGRNWIVGKNGTIDPNALAASALQCEPIEDAVFPGRWVLRARSTSNAFDCNGNGVLDSCDLAAGTSVDVDGSGRPDECEDCNANRVLDSIDIAAGTSADCQGDGTPDECQVLGGFDCNSDGIPDECQLAGADCNGNDTLDSCDLAAGTSADVDGTGIPDECEDCNRNGSLDSADILAGLSLDCDDDLVPDECQLGTPPTVVEYLLDAGVRSGNVGLGTAGDIIWMNSFNVEFGAEFISGIRVILGNAFAGVPYRVGVWSDPNQDGDPSDAQLLATGEAIADNGNTNIFNDVELPPTFVGKAGSIFFAGVLYRDLYGNQTPIAADSTAPDQRSWVAAGSTVDPNDLSAATYFGYFFTLDVLVRAEGGNGVRPFDCDGNGVPDECDIADGTLGDADGDGVPDCCVSPRGCGTCGSDLDGDGVVGPSDVTLLLGSWQGPGGDISGDGVTGPEDLTLLLGAWGPCL
jgi:hypothetical protein